MTVTATATAQQTSGVTRAGRQRIADSRIDPVHFDANPLRDLGGPACPPAAAQTAQP